MIDFNEPLQNATERTKVLLFRPFDAVFWLGLGFSAWLASMLEGTGIHSVGFGGKNDQKAIQGSIENMGEWDLILALSIAAIVLLVIGVLILVFLWLGTRGQFMFLDNIVNKRAEIKAPWREFRALGNDLFSFYIWITTIVSIVLLVFAAAAVFVMWEHWKELSYWLVLILVTLVLMIPLWIVFFIYREFGVPIIYKTRCKASDAFGIVWRLAMANPADMTLYVITRAAMGLIFFILTLLAILGTCCVGILPYVQSVVTLPLKVFRIHFTLGCLAQLDPAYDLTRPDLPPPPLPASPPPLS